MNDTLSAKRQTLFFEQCLHIPSRAITLCGDIDTEAFEFLFKGLWLLEHESNDPIIIHIQTEGGELYSGLGIFDAIKACQSRTTTVGWGEVCSMGAILLQAGDTRLLSKNAVFMFHEGSEELTGSHKTAKAWLEENARRNTWMWELFAERMKAKDIGITARQLENRGAVDKIFSAEKAIEVGLADGFYERFPSHEVARID